MKLYEIPFRLCCFPQNSWFSLSNGLAGMNVPPGNTSVFGFCYEPSGGDELPSGSATLFCTIFVVL